MDGYEIHDGRFIQTRLQTSAADAVVVNSAAVPAGKVWTVLMGLYVPSVGETRTVFWSIVTSSGQVYPIRVPVSIALSATLPYPLLTEGLELKLWPGDIVRMTRDVATAGSSMTSSIRLIETDLPFYSYEDPQQKIIRKMVQRRSAPDVAGGRVGTSPPAGFERGGRGGGGTQPI
jgi:hypothetical protein